MNTPPLALSVGSSSALLDLVEHARRLAALDGAADLQHTHLVLALADRCVAEVILSGFDPKSIAKSARRRILAKPPLPRAGVGNAMLAFLGRFSVVTDVVLPSVREMLGMPMVPDVERALHDAFKDLPPPAVVRSREVSVDGNDIVNRVVQRLRGWVSVERDANSVTLVRQSGAKVVVTWFDAPSIVALRVERRGKLIEHMNCALSDQNLAADVSHLTGVLLDRLEIRARD